MLYSHDTFGLGHLNRNLKIARALKNRFPAISILLVTGSPQAQRFKLPEGVDYVKLPAVHKVGEEGYAPRYLDIPFKQVLAVRTNILLQTVKEYRPHILLVDHSPLGMKKEILPSLEWVRNNKDTSRAMLGLRDILDDPAVTRKRWNDQMIYDVLREFYDRIFVYGMRFIYDPVAEYGISDDIRAKTSYCGYITDYDDGTELPKPDREKLVLVTIGGGDGGEGVIEQYLESLKSSKGKTDFKSIILTGPFLSRENWEKFHADANELGVKLLRCISEVRRLMRRSSLVLATGGYNTFTDILTHAHKAIVVPRILYRDEQLIRAKRFSQLGFIEYIHPTETTPERLSQALSESFSDNDSPLERARNADSELLNGGGRLSELIGESLGALKHARGK